jgi:hypothetical protein
MGAGGVPANSPSSEARPPSPLGGPDTEGRVKFTKIPVTDSFNQSLIQTGYSRFGKILRNKIPVKGDFLLKVHCYTVYGCKKNFQGESHVRANQALTLTIMT